MKLKNKIFYLVCVHFIVIFLLCEVALFSSNPSATSRVKEGSLVKGSTPAVYVIEDGKKRHIPDPATFKHMGFSWNAIRQISDEVLQQIADGQPLPSVKSQKPEKLQQRVKENKRKELEEKIRLSLCLPVEERFPISQHFGPSVRQDLQKAYEKWGYDGHFGIDFASPIGTSVFACDNGEVFDVNNDDRHHINGLYVRLKHSWGISYYGHLNKVTVGNGQRVAKCNSLGYSGATGFATGPHLHFGIKITGISNLGYKDYVDPFKYANFESPYNGNIIAEQERKRAEQLKKALAEKQKAAEERKRKELEEKKKQEDQLKKELAEKQRIARKNEEEQLRARLKFYEGRIKSVETRLLNVIPNPPNIHFRLVKSKNFGAWSDGSITTMTMEFLYPDSVTSPDDQLAMVLAHEIAHVQLKRNMLYKMLHNALKSDRERFAKVLELLFGNKIWTNSFKTNIKRVYNFWLDYLLNDFSRDQESAADFFGLLFVQRAGFNVQEAINFFERKKDNKKNASVRDYLRDHLDTHPSWRTRHETLVKRAEDIAKAEEERKRLAEIKKKEREAQRLAATSGSLLREHGQSKVYVIMNGARRHIPNEETFKILGLNWNKINNVDSNTIRNIPVGNTLPVLRNGMLVQIQGRLEIYVIEANAKRHIPDPATFKHMGFSWNAIRQISDEVLRQIPDGQPLPSIKSQKPARKITSLHVTSLRPSKISASSAPYDAKLLVSGTNFNNINRVTLTWSGVVSGNATWNRGGSNWRNKVTVNSNTSMVLRPRVVEASPTWSGTANWTVTLRDTTGKTASRSLKVTYMPIPAKKALQKKNTIQIGSTVTVVNTGGIGLRMRSSPGLKYPKIKTLSDGTRMKVIGGPVRADGYTWWRIQGNPGTGWSVGNWLSP